jgi:hypothetical protein
MALKRVDLLKDKCMKRALYVVILTLSFVACKQHKDLSQELQMIKNSNVVKASQQAVIYKTNEDFNDYVPVIMDDRKTKIISYPAPADLFYGGKLAKPTVLKNGYLLDNRGINQNVVFLNYTYEFYSQLKNVPTLKDMSKNIKEKYPLKELILCGLRYRFKDEVKELNALIDAGLPGCEKIAIIPMGVTLDK